MKHHHLVFALALILPLAAAAEEGLPEIPEAIPAPWAEKIAEDLPVGQSLAQTIVADLDGDGTPEWIALSEPDSRNGKVWAHIYEKTEEDRLPTRIWRQPLYGEKFRVVRGFVREVRPFPTVLVVVASEPFHTGDSRFRVQMIGWNRDAYRQMVPEDAEFRSQGGFRFEDAKSPYSGDALLLWTYIRGDGELLYDYHHYEYNRFHFDGFRFAVQQEPDRTKKKHPNQESAAKEAGATGPDLRRYVDTIAEIP